VTKTWMSAGLVLALAAIGCGRSDEERLQALAARLDQQRDAVAEAKSFADEKAQAVADAEADLEAARDQLRTAEQQLHSLEEQAAETASDPVLFRLVQKRLLESGELEGVAIAATVEGGRVTLTGEVPEDDLRKRAGEIAGEVPGVVSVKNEIRVLAPVAAEPSGPTP